MLDLFRGLGFRYMATFCIRLIRSALFSIQPLRLLELLANQLSCVQCDQLPRLGDPQNGKMSLSRDSEPYLASRERKAKV